MSATPLSLKALLVSNKTVETAFPGLPGFKVTLGFLSRDTLLNIRKKATRTHVKNRQTVEELDDKLFLQLYAKSSVLGWTGLKLHYLEQLVPVDLEGQNLEDELPYSEENALFLMQGSPNFDAFVSETVTELSNFKKSSV